MVEITMMKKTLVIIAVLMSVKSFASTSYSGVISNIHFMSNGVILVSSNGSRDMTGGDACFSNQSARFAFDSTTPGGRTQLTGLLTAYSTGKKLTIIGTNSCGPWGDTETINYFYFDE